MGAVHLVRWTFHGTVMVPEYDRTLAFLQRWCGCRVLQDEVDTRPAIARRGGMAWIGDNIVELAQPLDAASATGKFLQRFGPGGHSLALQVQDMDATTEFLAARDVRMPVRPMPHFGFSDPRDTEGLLLEWYAGQHHDDPRFGRAIPDYAVPPRIDVPRMAWFGALVHNPAASAARLAELLGTEMLFSAPEAPPGAPQAAVSLRDGVLALYPLPNNDAVWGGPQGKPRVHLHVVQTPDLALARAAFAAEGIGLLRDEAHLLLPHPAESGDCLIGFTDRLLAGDPRS